MVGNVVEREAERARLTVLRLAVDQTSRALRFQRDALAEEGAKNERASRFAAGVLVLAVATLGLMVSAGLTRDPPVIGVVAFLFTLFFAQASFSSIRLYLLSIASGTGDLAAGPSPAALLQGVRSGPWNEGAWLLETLRQMEHDFSVNNQNLEAAATRRARWATVNLLAITWLAVGAAIYVTGGFLRW